MKVESGFPRYALALAACGLALMVALPLDAPSSCFFLAVMVSALYGSKGPGLFATALSAVCFDYFWLPPLIQFFHRAVFVPSPGGVSWGSPAQLVGELFRILRIPGGTILRIRAS
jgi:hypothetical protein